MKQLLKNIASWLFTKIKELDFKDWILIIVTIVAIVTAISARYYYNKSLYPTVIYNTDSLEVYKNKLEEEYRAKNIYVQSIDQLKQNNSELYDEIKNLKDNPIVVTKTNIVVKTDTVYMTSDSIIAPNDTLRELYWSVNEQNGYYAIKGQTNVRTDFSSFDTQINLFNIPITMTMDIIEKDKQLQFIGRSDNPYVTITNVNGVIVDPTKSDVIKSYFKPKRWSVGPQVGVGVSSDLKITPYIGVGITYGILQW